MRLFPHFAGIGKDFSAMTKIHGFVDGERGSDVVGWILNDKNPSNLEDVVFKSENGKSLTAKAFLYRLDVCRAFSKTGKFGFAVPVRSLLEIGRNFQVTNRFGELLSNGTLTISAKDEGVSQDPHKGFIFLHIQKCAGTSLRSSLQERLPQSASLMIYPGGIPGLSLQELNSLPLHQRQSLRLLIGHTYFGIGKFLGQQARYLTFLRDPLARLKSNYWHHRVAGMDAIEIGGVSVPLHVAVNEGLSEEFDNLQTRMVAGTAASEVPLGRMTGSELALALHNIDTSFAFVGLAEQMAEDLPRLCEVIGIPAAPVRFENITPRSGNDITDLDYAKIDWTKVLQNNRIDVELYREIQARRARPVAPAAVPQAVKRAPAPAIERIAS